jgi:SAM-dependent methyltransferase
MDSTVAFYTRVNALLEPHMTVLDFGAGRGGYMQQAPNYRRDLRKIHGKVAKVIGVDVDSAVYENKGVDEAYVIEPGGRVPLEDDSVDLILSDWVLEHVDDPQAVAAELDRVLRPGGWLCARTPNKYGYIATSARLVPNPRHAQMLTRLQPKRREQDVFPTRYLLNTRRQLRLAFPEDRFELHVYTHNPDPYYFGNSVTAWRAVTTVSRLLPQALGAHLMIFAHKR